MQLSMTVHSPKGSSGLNTPMRFDWPAARRIAATSFTSRAKVPILECGQRSATPPWMVSSTVALFRTQLFQGANRVLPRHLLAPVHYEVRVIQRSSFDVAGFGGGLNTFVVERLSQQYLSSVWDFDWRRSNATEDQLRSFDCACLIHLYPGCNAQYGEVKRAPATQLLVGSGPSVRRRKQNVYQQFIRSFFQIVDAVIVVEPSCVNHSFAQR